jgi:hypothetical protein
LGALAGVGDVVQKPLDLGAGEVGVEQEAGALAEEGLQAAAAKVFAKGGCAAVLPDDGVGDGSAAAVPARWLVMPIEATSAGVALACAITSRAVSNWDCQIASGSCSTHPG